MRGSSVVQTLGIGALRAETGEGRASSRVPAQRVATPPRPARGSITCMEPLRLAAGARFRGPDKLTGGPRTHVRAPRRLGELG